MSSGYSKVKVQKCNRALYSFLSGAVRVGCVLAGIRVKFSNKCEKLPEGPAVVLCNHGSLLDFVYTGTFLRKCFPHYVIARYYFYNKWLSRLLKQVGGFPKSQLEVDVESTKNCLRVLQDGEVLFMMPEARIGISGRFEDIQDGTYSFLKKVKVPVYTIHLRGNYFSYPKWGKGPRRGAVVESELEQLFTAQELEHLSVKEIKQAVEARLWYDEFRWLQTRPEVHYHSRRLAEGLENILSICPICKSRHTITTKHRNVYCEHCGKLTSLDSRYGFSGEFLFDNFANWYDWQKNIMREEIARDPDFVLEQAVELQLSSEDGKTTTRKAGNGVCKLSREGLTYVGTRDGEPCTCSFALKRIYRLIFDAGRGFQVHDGSSMLYFVLEEGRSAVDWYLTSMLLYDEMYGKTPALPGSAEQ